MAKTSNNVPQKEAPSSSRLVGGEDAAEPRPEEFVPLWLGCLSQFRILNNGLKDLGRTLPPSGDEEVPVPKQFKEKNIKYVPSSLVSEKKKLTKKSRKLKGPPDVMLSESIRRLRDDPEEGEDELVGVRANVVIQQSSESAEVNTGTLVIIPEQEKAETIRSRAEMVEGETEGRTSLAAEDISRDELGIVNISGYPQILDAMIREASMMEGRSNEGIQEPTDIHGFLDGLESAASEEVIGFGGLPIPKKTS
uniref:Uncharacterized protein n=1 Tax=Nicotiana tabacum TaxID=4097 RepID=A0A1S4B9L3_TOBAC|nr:PREDICTED: uncharacterized protein LOC107805938 [Nicotiana tabacum]